MYALNGRRNHHPTVFLKVKVLSKTQNVQEMRNWIPDGSKNGFKNSIRQCSINTKFRRSRNSIFGMNCSPQPGMLLWGCNIIPQKKFFKNCHFLQNKNKNSFTTPGFNWNDFRSDIHVLFYVDGAVDDMVPDGRVVSPVYHVDLYLNWPRKWRETFVLSFGFQLVSLTLRQCYKKRSRKGFPSAWVFWKSWYGKIGVERMFGKRFRRGEIQIIGLGLSDSFGW